jgi:hypothetical protein
VFHCSPPWLYFGGEILRLPKNLIKNNDRIGYVKGTIAKREAILLYNKGVLIFTKMAGNVMRRID